MDLIIPKGCKKCTTRFEVDFTMAFQPIVDVSKREIFGYEALVRDKQTRTAKTILDQVNSDNCHSFDQQCRTKAIFLAKELGLQSMLSINFLPNSVYKPELCICNTIQAAELNHFPLEKIMFEVVENEKAYDLEHLKSIFEFYKIKGFRTAIDDFGTGYSSLDMLSHFIPDVIKLDIDLVTEVDKNPVKQIIAESTIDLAGKLGIQLLAEGVETLEEMRFFEQRGVALMQGFYFAKPGYECLPKVDFSILD